MRERHNPSPSTQRQRGNQHIRGQRCQASGPRHLHKRQVRKQHRQAIIRANDKNNYPTKRWLRSWPAKSVPRLVLWLLGILLRAVSLALPAPFRVWQLEFPDHWRDEQGPGSQYSHEEEPLCSKHMTLRQTSCIFTDTRKQEKLTPRFFQFALKAILLGLQVDKLGSQI